MDSKHIATIQKLAKSKLIKLPQLILLIMAMSLVLVAVAGVWLFG